jgi:glycogen operon protein
MLLAGDELGRTQRGNNNAYCQDNEISWVDWAAADEDLLAFTRKLIRLRKDHPVFCRRRWFQGLPIKGSGVEDIAWFLPEGTEMTRRNWSHDFAKSLAVFLNGKGLRSRGPSGEQIVDDSFYVIFNAYHGPICTSCRPASTAANGPKSSTPATAAWKKKALPTGPAKTSSWKAAPWCCCIIL